VAGDERALTVSMGVVTMLAKGGPLMEKRQETQEKGGRR
jgi:hypothetical protein